MNSDSFGARSTLEVSGRSYEVFRLDALQQRFDVARLPYCSRCCSRTCCASRTGAR